MARRNLILGIVKGIDGKLKSRNNDISGNPGAGFIYTYTKSKNYNKCHFNLLTGESHPSLGFEKSFTEVYQYYIYEQLAKYKLSRNVISQASIEYEFDLNSCEWTNIYFCRTILVSDLGKDYSTEHYGSYSKYVDPINGEPVVRPFYKK